MDSPNKINTFDPILAIILALLFITGLMLPIKVVILEDVCDFLKGDKFTDLLMALFAAITLFYTYMQYKDYRKREKSEVLGQYNERYSRDEHVNKVVDYIIRHMEGEYIIKKPTTHDAEMFMRFFEEMQIQIDNDRLDENQVFDLFAYYAMVFDADERLRNNLGIEDYDKDKWVWSIFKTFASNMIIRHLKDIRWEPIDKNTNNKSLYFYKAAANSESKSAHQDEIYNFSYEKGIITVEGKEKYLYVFSGSNKPDELHCISGNMKYIGIRIDRKQ